MLGLASIGESNQLRGRLASVNISEWVDLARPSVPSSERVLIFKALQKITENRQAMQAAAATKQREFKEGQKLLQATHYNTSTHPFKLCKSCRSKHCIITVFAYGFVEESKSWQPKCMGLD